eukprot:1642453-Amphidinium_carterae.1
MPEATTLEDVKWIKTYQTNHEYKRHRETPHYLTTLMTLTMLCSFRTCAVELLFQHQGNVMSVGLAWP